MNYTWEEDFLEDDKSTLCLDGVRLGHVQLIKGSWACLWGDKTDAIAVRPDKRSAQALIFKVAQSKEKP